MIDPYATHLPMLMGMMSRTAGPVLELGCGYYSTPILHEICKFQKRLLVSVEEKPDWLKQFAELKTAGHEFCLSDDRAAVLQMLENIDWGLVFIDNEPVEYRKLDIDRLRKNADCFVIHDTENAAYQFEPVLRTFKYRFDYKFLTPWTSVVSDCLKLDFL